MKKVNISVFGIIIVVGIILAGVVITTFNASKSSPSENVATTTPVVVVDTVKNSSYIVEGKTFALVNGKASVAIAPSSATKETVSIFGEPVYGDLNGDGNASDAAVMLVRNSGGSGTFYYAVLSIASEKGQVATNVLFLGDRIAPQTVEIRDGRATYNYAERKAGEAMTVQPSVGKSLTVHYDSTTKTIGELAKNFEGEANPSMMSLSMKKWVWINTKMNDGTVTVPKRQGAFTLTFGSDKKVSVGTDCNSMGGTYVSKGNTLTFSSMMSTMMYCEGSQEQDFSASLQNVASFMFTSKGELVLEIKMDSGTMLFK